MNKKQFRRYLDRDEHCPCCGSTGDTLVPQHRAGRGMGGSKELDRPANIIVMCSRMNGLIESNANYAAEAREFGWKLARWEIPEEKPFFDSVLGLWSTIDNAFARTYSK